MSNEPAILDKLREFCGFLDPKPYWLVYDYEPDLDDEDLCDGLISVAALSAVAKSAGTDTDQINLRIEKSILEQLGAKLEEEPELNKGFVATTGWKALDRLLTVARLKELTKVRITKKGGRGTGLRFDITELSNTFFGKKILAGLEFGRRRSLKRDELDKVEAACSKLKLKLPKITEPTTTENFFTEDDE